MSGALLLLGVFDGAAPLGAIVVRGMSAASFKKSTAANRPVLMIRDTDHMTGATGLTLTVEASKNGAAFAGISPTVTELGYGWYNLALTSGHTDTVGLLALHVTAPGADPTELCDQVAPPVDAVYLNGRMQTPRDVGLNVLLEEGTGTGQVDLASGVAKVNVTHWADYTVPPGDTNGYPIVTIKDGTGQGELLTTAGKAEVLVDAGDITGDLPVDLQTIKGQSITCAAPVTFPALLASTTNITAGVVTTVSGNVAGNVSGNVVGSVGSVLGNLGGNVQGNVGGDVVGDVRGNLRGNVNANVLGSVTRVLSVVTANTTKLAGQPVIAGSSVTFPSQIASPTNILYVDRVGELVIAPTVGDFTGTMQNTLIDILAANPVNSVLGNVNGNVVGYTGSINTDGITAASISTSGLNKIVDQVWDEDVTQHGLADSTGLKLASIHTAVITVNNAIIGISERLPITLSADGFIMADVRAVSDSEEAASALEDFLLANPDVATSIASAVWGEDLSLYAANTAGNLVYLGHAHLDQIITAFVVDGDVYSLSANAVKRVWDVPTIEHVTAGTFGKLAADHNTILTTTMFADIADAVLNTAMTESYAADGAEGTLAQLSYMIYSVCAEFEMDGTTITCKRLNGVNTAMTFAVDDPVTPTLRTRNT